jgi:chitinase
MPAICQNVQIWHNNAALSSWHTQGDWAGWFTYDLGASKSREGRGGQRGDKMCPDSWKRTIFNPRCPETNQPRVVPPLYYLNGIGVTVLVPRSIPGETELRMIIADGKDDPRPFVGQLQSSGRKYTCDEFPPASWIEGGVGLGGAGLPGTTYCAPWAFKCGDDTDARGSEQTWQGFIHGFLGGHLEAQLVIE